MPDYTFAPPPRELRVLPRGFAARPFLAQPVQAVQAQRSAIVLPKQTMPDRFNLNARTATEPERRVLHVPQKREIGQIKRNLLPAYVGGAFAQFDNL